MLEQQISFAGGSGGGVLVTPDDQPKPAVIVLQEWWGLNANILDITRSVAGAGFVALAPDLYHGRVTVEPDQARKLAMELDRERALQEINGAINFVQAMDIVQPKGVGVIGFCMGGGLALHVAAANRAVAAAVAWYGGGAPNADAFAGSNAALLNLLAERDESVTERITALDAALTAANYAHAHEVIVYPGVEHAFYNVTRPEVYAPAAAQDSWLKARDWLYTHLRQ